MDAENASLFVREAPNEKHGVRIRLWFGQYCRSIISAANTCDLEPHRPKLEERQTRVLYV